MLESYGYTQGLEAGERFNVAELFYPLLIESSNDAAEVLGSILGKEQTIKLMNEKAKSILMPDTEFVDPHGFAPENISTSQDLFYLARYILINRPPIWKITRGEEGSSFAEVSFKNLNNKNLFFDSSNFIGGKTGFIATSGYNGIFLFSFNTKEGTKRDVAIVLLGSKGLKLGWDNLKKDVEKIDTWLEENYFSKQ
jgi:D-alanyl-D-alanine carboxypeptidase